MFSIILQALVTLVAYACAAATHALAQGPLWGISLYGEAACFSLIQTARCAA